MRIEDAMTEVRCHWGTLVRNWAKGDHAFCLHVDTNKLEQIATMLEAMNDAIEDERRNPQ